MKKTLALMGYILLFIVTAIVFLFSIGTVFPAIPIIEQSAAEEIGSVTSRKQKTSGESFEKQ